MAEQFDQRTAEELGDLNKNLKELIDKLGSSSGGATKSTSSSGMSALAKAAEEAAKHTNEATEEKKKETEQIKEIHRETAKRIEVTRDLTDETKKYLEEHGTMTQKLAMMNNSFDEQALASVNKSFASNLGPLGKGFEDFAKNNAVLGTSIAVAGIAVGAFAGKVMNVLESFDSLAKSGVTVGGGFAGLMTASAGLNMSMDQFASLATEHARTINKFGIQEFQAGALGIRDSMMGLGLTTSETSEYLADYLETQRLTGAMAQMSGNQQAQAAQRLMSQTDSLAVAFGASREAVLDGVVKAYDDPMIQATLRGLPQGAKEAFDKSMAFFSASVPAMADSIQELMGSAIPQMTDAYQNAMQAGVPGVATAMMEFTNNIKAGMDSEEARNKLLSKMATQDTHRLRILASAGDENAKSMLAQVEQAKQAMEARKLETEAEKKARLENQKSASGVRQAFEQLGTFGDKVMAGLLGSLGGSGGVEAGVKKLSGVVSDFANWLGDTAIPSAIKFGEAMGPVVSGLGLVGSAIGSVFGVFRDIGVGLGEVAGHIVMNFDDIGENFKHLIKGMGLALLDILPTGMSDGILSFFNGVTEMFSGVSRAIDNLMDGGSIIGFLGEMFDGLLQMVTYPITALIDYIGGTDISGMLSEFGFTGMIMEGIGNLFDKIVDTITSIELPSVSDLIGGEWLGFGGNEEADDNARLRMLASAGDLDARAQLEQQDSPGLLNRIGNFFGSDDQAEVLSPAASTELATTSEKISQITQVSEKQDTVVTEQINTNREVVQSSGEQIAVLREVAAGIKSLADGNKKITTAIKENGTTFLR
jgi:hypothetical protein